jgi:GT2 family glycosyltransferase
MDVTVSIVSYNSRNVLKDCIDSIIRTTENSHAEIIIVDNASEDGSAALVREHFPDIRLIENRENVGFGRAHNQAFRISRGRYFLILNPDTIIYPEAISNMIKFMDGHERAGASGCKIWWDNSRNFIFPDLRIHNIKTALLHFTHLSLYFPNNFLLRNLLDSAYGLWRSKQPVKVEGITGGMMLVRREVFERVGMFDENFFLFFEEHDLLRRISSAGWDIYYIPGSEIQHFFQESCRNCFLDTGKDYLESAFYYYKKHYGTIGALFIRSLIRLNRLITSHERSIYAFFPGLKTEYTKVYPRDDSGMLIEWPAHPEAVEYVVEISYSTRFCDRAGMFVTGNSLVLNSEILKRLPDSSGFLRILPVCADNKIGKVIKLIKITGQGREHES